MSDGKIVQFRRPEAKPVRVKVWQCGCGSQKWALHVGGEVVCWECKNVTRMQWYDPDESRPGSA